MRIGILCHPTYGGSGVLASELAIQLAERGNSVHLFSHAVPPRLAKCEGGVHVHVARGMPYPIFEAPPHNLAITSSILDVFATSGLDLLHAHYAIPNATSALLAQAAVQQAGGRLPVITTLHGTDINLVGKDESYAALTKYALHASDAVTCVSSALVEDTYTCILKSRELPLVVIPNFVDLSKYAGPFSRSGACVRILHASNFRSLKRVGWLVQAFAKCVHLTESKVELHLIGDGPERAQVEATAISLGLGDRVRFMGERDDLPGLLASSDIFALSSTQESFGLASLEAMAAGLPVVSTDVGGVAEVVDHGTTGFLCSVNDIEAYAQALAKLIESPTLRSAMGAAGKRRAAIRFSSNTVVDRYEALYREVWEK
jgi:L-malate glycosyltransferase